MKKIPFLSLASQHQQIQAVVRETFCRVYEQNAFVLGTELQLFEQEFARFTGVSSCVGVGNGLDALTFALKTCNLTPADEVIVPAHTYIATWLAVSHCGARIVPVEPDESTFNIDVGRIESAITLQTKVILPVHLYGQPCDMTAIGSIAEKHNLLVVEDNAQAHGAKWGGRLTGSFGTVNATSFYPSKNLGALGDGGAITTDNLFISEQIKRYRNYGLSEKNVAATQGVNSRLDNLQAAVLRIKLKYLREWNEERKKLAAFYLKNLLNVGDIILPFCHPEAFHVYHLFVIRTAYRNKLKEHLSNEGIETMIHYPTPPHLQKAYDRMNFRKASFPRAERMANTILSLPLWPGLKQDEIEFVVDCIKQFFKKGM